MCIIFAYKILNIWKYIYEIYKIGVKNMSKRKNTNKQLSAMGIKRMDNDKETRKNKGRDKDEFMEDDI